MDPAISALVGAVIGASAGILGTVLLMGHETRTRRKETKRDAYLDFIDAVDGYHLGLLDHSTQAEYFAQGVGSRQEVMAAVQTLKATRTASTAAYRRLSLFGDSDTQAIGEETLKLVIGFPEFDLNTWHTNPSQIQTDLQKISDNADEVEAKIHAFLRSCRTELGFGKPK